MRFVVLTLIFALGCVATPDAAETETSDFVIATGTQGRLASSDAPARRRAPWIEVASNRETFEQLWNDYVPGDPPADISFDSKLPVFLLLAPQPTGGYAIEPISVETDERILRVHARLVQPMSPDDFTTQVVTAPYAVISAPSGSYERVEWIDADGRLLATRIPE